MKLPDKVKLLLKSRKFWTALIAVGLVALRAYKPDFPLTDDELTKIVLILAAFILGVGLEDAGAGAGKVGNGQ